MSDGSAGISEDTFLSKFDEAEAAKKFFDKHPLWMGLRSVFTFVKSMKLVGFTFDGKLNWSGMLKNTASKGRSVLGALYRMRLLLKPIDLQMI